ncbi:MAG: IS21-like element helper ATPase IstB [Planctomycetes bacterium]|nr:IS21-like element helper ATPase IstB [Planctomycetota bacterium]
MKRSASCDLEAGLKRLHLPTIRRMCSPIFEQAEKESWTYREVLEQLVAEEIANRAETRIKRSTRKAHFPFLKTIEEFDFEFQRSVRRQMLGRFLGPELVEEGRSLVLLGEPGRGKTHLAIGIAYKAIQNGYDARFTTAAQLLNDMHVAALDGNLQDVLVQYIAPDVLVIDELGYLSYGPDAANSLFHVVDQRYLKRKPIVITSNKEPEEWGNVLHDPDLAEAIVDRLEEHGDVIRLKGRSYRRRKSAPSEKAGSAREELSTSCESPPP